MRLFAQPGAFIMLFDAECPICRRSVAFLRSQKGAEAIRFVPLQEPGMLSRFDIKEADALREIHVVGPNGSIRRGADGVIWAVSALDRWRWVEAAAKIPGFMPVARRVYGFIASRRQREFCTDHQCG